MKNTIKFDDFIKHFSLQSSGFKHIKNNNVLYIIGDENTLLQTKEFIEKLTDIIHIDVLKKYPLAVSKLEFNDGGFDIDFESSNESFNESILETEPKFIELIQRILDTIKIKHLDILQGIFNDLFYNVYHQIKPEIKLVYLESNNLKNKLDLTYIMGLKDDTSHKLHNSINSVNSTTSLIYIKDNFNWVSFTDMVGLNEINDKNLFILMSKFNNKIIENK